MYFRELSKNFWVKFFVVDLNPGTGALLTPGSGMEKSGFGILDKHSGSATLVYFIIHIGTKPETSVRFSQKCCCRLSCEHSLTHF